MKNKTVYLLYNTNATGIQLHQKPSANLREVKGKVVWEYIDRDKFTITYSPDDDRNFTDITILSKTKLKDRPKTADSFFKQTKGKVEGLVFQKSSSLSLIEDLFLERRNPLIKPLLSETEIKSLQRFQEQCRHRHLSPGAEKRTGSSKGWGLSGNPSGKEVSAYTEEKRKENLLLESNVEEDRQTNLRNVHLEDNILRSKRDLGIVESSTYQGHNDKKAKKEIGEHLFSRKLPLKGTTNKEIIKTPKGNKQTENNTRGDTDSKTPKITRKTAKKDHLDRYQEYDRKTKKHKNSFQDNNISEKQILDLNGSISDYPLSKESAKKLSRGKSKSRDNLKKIDFGNKHEKAKDGKSLIFENTEQSNRSEKLDRVANEARKNSTPDGMITAKSTGSSSKEDRHKDRRLKSQDSQDDSGKQKSSKLQVIEKRIMEKRSAKGEFKAVKSRITVDTDLAYASSKASKLKSESRHNKVKVKEDVAAKKSKRGSAVIQYMIQYILSNPVFIKFGWTLQPVDRSLSTIVTFKALPATPNSYCFRQRNEEEIKFYPGGSLAVRMETDGTGAVYYPSGSPAVIATSHDRGMRLTLYSNPKMDSLVKDSSQAKVIGMFDNFGNGVVYDLQGNKVVQYNQLEGVFNNAKRRIPSKWRWSCYKELEEQRIKVLLRSMVKNEKYPSPPLDKKVVSTASSNIKKGTSEKKSDADYFYESILAELPYPAPLKSKIKSKSQATGFKSVILKINEEMTLRINGQNNIIWNFSKNKFHYRLELGVVVDAEVVERIDELAVDKIGEVPCVFDALLHLSPSLTALKPQRHS